MLISPIRNNFNTPYIANPKERQPLQPLRTEQRPAVGFFDLWVNPEKYRAGGSGRHSLDVLA